MSLKKNDKFLKQIILAPTLLFPQTANKRHGNVLMRNGYGVSNAPSTHQQPAVQNCRASLQQSVESTEQRKTRRHIAVKN